MAKYLYVERGVMARQVSDAAIERLFPVDKGPPCPEGTALLRSFGEQWPSDFASLKPSDLVDLRNSDFADLREWDAFAEHYSTCELCNA